MSLDYIVLTVIGALGLCGGLYLLHKAKNYRARRHNGDLAK